jgi:hypothetical protein
VVGIVSKLGGSATKGVPDAGRLSVLVDLAANRESEFRAAVASINGEKPGSTTLVTESTSATGEKKSFVVHIVETAESQ